MYKNKKIIAFIPARICNNIKDTLCDNCINSKFKNVKPICEHLATKFHGYKLDLPEQIIKEKGE